MNRRKALRNTALGLGTLAVGAAIRATDAATRDLDTKTNHSTCYWCYGDMALDELAERGKDVGLQSIELTTVKQWPTLKKHGLT